MQDSKKNKIKQYEYFMECCHSPGNDMNVYMDFFKITDFHKYMPNINDANLSVYCGLLKYCMIHYGEFYNIKHDLNREVYDVMVNGSFYYSISDSLMLNKVINSFLPFVVAMIIRQKMYKKEHGK